MYISHLASAIAFSRRVGTRREAASYPGCRRRDSPWRLSDAQPSPHILGTHTRRHKSDQLLGDLHVSGRPTDERGGVRSHVCPSARISRATRVAHLYSHSSSTPSVSGGTVQLPKRTVISRAVLDLLRVLLYRLLLLFLRERLLVVL